MKIQSIVLNNYYDIKITHLCGMITHEFANMSVHSHEHCEIFIHLKGNFTVCVEKNFYKIQDNTIRLYRSDELHYGKIDTIQNLEWYQISIPKKFFSKKENTILGKCMYDRKAGTNNVFAPKNFLQISNLISEAFDKFEEQNVFYPFYFESAIIKILCLLNEKNEDICIHDIGNITLQNIIGIIFSEFPSISSIYDLSVISNYSASYIHKLFKENLNITPYQFIIDKKLTEAAKALQKGKNVSEACQYAGFDNYTNFITLFKHKFNVTPKKYQKLNK